MSYAGATEESGLSISDDDLLLIKLHEVHSDRRYEDDPLFKDWADKRR